MKFSNKGISIFFMTEEEESILTSWLAKEKFNPLSENLLLYFESSVYGDSLSVCIDRASKSCFEIYDLPDTFNRSAPLNHFNFKCVHFDLTISTEEMEECRKLTASKTEVHVNNDCEPSGMTIIMEHNFKKKSIYCCNENIKTHEKMHS